MPEQRLLLPFLTYAALGMIALVRPSGPRRDWREKSFAARSRQDRGGPLPLRQALHQARGAKESSPWKIPAKEWPDILWRTYAKINDHRLFLVAAGVVFYGLLALFPAITAFVSLYGLFADSSTIDSQVSALSFILPGGAVQIVHEELTRLAANKSASLGFGFLVGLIVALWSANAGTKAIIDALNVAYGEKEKRSFIRLNLVSLAYTLVGMVLMMLAIAVVVVTPIVLGRVGLGAMADTLTRILRWPVLLALVLVGLAAMYGYLPCRPTPQWRWLTPGSAFASVTWLASSLLFSWYIANFGNYNATYGSLGAAIGMMTWLWISTIVMLVGAQLNAEIERQTASGPKKRAEGPTGVARGERRAREFGAPG